MAYKFKVGDTGKTRGGREYRVICVDRKVVGDSCVVALLGSENGLEYPTYRTPDGRRIKGNHIDVDDLTPPTVTKWLNVCMDSDGTCVSYLYPSEDVAKTFVTETAFNYIITAQPVEVPES